MRGLYLTWPNEQVWSHIEYAANSGKIDTLLVACSDVPVEPPSNYYPALKSVRESMSRGMGLGLTVYPVYQWDRQWTSPESATKRLNDLSSLGLPCIIDWEDYRRQSSGVPQPPVPNDVVDMMISRNMVCIGAMPERGSFGGISFIEDTYDGKDFFDRVKFKYLKHKGDICAGVNIDIEGPKYIKATRRCFKSYWLWCAACLGQNGNVTARPWQMEWWDQL